MSFKSVILSLTTLLGCEAGPTYEPARLDETSTAISYSPTTVTASGDDGNLPENAIDGNLDTRWSCNGIGCWIQLDLGGPKPIDGVSVAWYLGDTRSSSFVVSTSTDGDAFTERLSRSSSGTSVALEPYAFPAVDARYVRVTVNGNSQTSWASITELAATSSGTVEATASADDGNGPANVLDGNLATRWSCDGIGCWIQLDHGTQVGIAGVDIAWYRGDTRASNFVVATSKDGTSFTTRLAATSSGTTLQLEPYTFAVVGARHVRVTVNGNSDNNWASITELHARVGPPPPEDTTPPTVPTGLATSSATTSSVTLGWTASTDNVELAGYELFLDGTRLTTVTSTSHTFAGLDCGETYTLGVTAFDAAGNHSASATKTATTAPCPSITLEIHSSDDAFLQDGTRYNNEHLKVETTSTQVRTSYLKFAVTGIGSRTVSSAKLRLAVDEDGGSGTLNVHRGSHSTWTETTLAPSNAPAKSGLLTSATGTFAVGQMIELDVSGAIAADGTYTFVLDLAAGGNDVWLSSDEGAVRPKLVVVTAGSGTGDTIAPTQPTGLTMSGANSTSISVRWIASTDNVGVVGYDRYRDGVKVATGTGTTAAFDGLACNRSYLLGITARDAAGNVSPRATITASTTACTEPGPTNVGKTIGAHNTGHAAYVVDAANTVIHQPRTLTTHQGNFTTTSNGQVIEGLHITGVLFIKHDNVVVRDCRIRNVWENGGIRKAPRIEWSTIGTLTGVEDPDNYNSSAVRLGDFTIYRTQIFGFIDLIHPEHGNMKLVESWLHSPYADPTSRHHGGNSAHDDPIQPRPSFPGWQSFLIQGNRFDTWPYKPGQQAGAAFGDLSPKPSTSGAFNFEFARCRNTTFRDNYIDGNYSQAVYNFYGAKELGNSGPPVGTVIIDNIWRLRRKPCGGSVSFMNFGDSSAKVVYGRNVDAETGNPIPNKPSGCGGGAGTVIAPGPSSQYPTYY